MNDKITVTTSRQNGVATVRALTAPVAFFACVHHPLNRHRVPTENDISIYFPNEIGNKECSLPRGTTSTAVSGLRPPDLGFLQPVGFSVHL